jgi:uncharacterized membrane protein YsdA (DUF1294 family)
MDILKIYILMMSTLTFLFCGLDKMLATHESDRRISERTLILLCVLGGGPGFLIGMYLFRHKTRHKKFTVGVPIICAVWLAAYLYFWLR